MRTRVLGVATIVSMGWLVAFGLGFSPADRDQEEAVRILYVHVPTIWIAYLAFVVTALGSAIYLFGRNHSLGFDRLAGASAEIGVAFVAVTLVVGSLWGRLTWGVFWRWDPRLTTTALLFVSYIGYLAVRRLGGSHHQRARRSAVIGLLAVLEIPLVHWSVRLWRSLHQEATVLNPNGDVDMDGLMLFSLFVGVVSFTLLYVWLMMHRTRAMAMEDLLDDRGLDVALRGPARRGEREAGDDGGRRVHPRQLRRDVRDGRVHRLAVRPSRPPAVRAGPRRRQVLAMTITAFPDQTCSSRWPGRSDMCQCDSAAARRRDAQRWIPIVVLGLVLVAGGVIITQFLRSAVDYYCNADEIGVRSGCDADRRLRVQGIVDAGSVSEVER